MSCAICSRQRKQGQIATWLNNLPQRQVSQNQAT
jgi:hypothetical protein